MRFRTMFGCGWIAAGLVLLVPASAWPAESVAPPVSSFVFHGGKYTTCTIDPAKQDLRMYWADRQGNVFGDFSALQKQVAAEGGHLLFAANAGMFDPAGKPVGLLVQDGTEKAPLNLADGTGNFFMKPNGVFLINQHRHALIVKADDYPVLATPAVWATQSGPMLVLGGDVNPDFMPESKNRKIRSGVGVTMNGEVMFALSRQPVTFYEFADLFLERLHCPNALYLDGDISDFWTPGDIEKDGQHHFGPMIGVVAEPIHEGVTAPPTIP